MTFRWFVHHFQILKARFLYVPFILTKHVKVWLRAVKHSMILDCSTSLNGHYKKVWKRPVKSIPKQRLPFSDSLFSCGNVTWCKRPRDRLILFLPYDHTCVEAQWPDGQCARSRRERSGFGDIVVVFLDSLTNCGEVTCDGLASHPGGVEILLAASCYGNRDKLRQRETVVASRLHYDHTCRAGTKTELFERRPSNG